MEIDFYGALSVTDVVFRMKEGYGRLRPPLRRAAMAALTLFKRNGTRIQRHGEAASYIFTGSHPGLMHQLFGVQERPFFGQARVFRLGPLSAAGWIEYVGDRFAHHLWERTTRGGEATPETWAEAFDAVLEEHGEGLQAVWDALGSNERSVLAALSLSSESLFNRRTLARFNLSKGAAQHAREKLAHVGHLHQVEGEWRPVDPLLVEWISRLEARVEGIGPR